MQFSFQNKVVLITGAAAGLGRATAEAFANHGAKILAVDIDATRGPELVRALGDRTAMFVEADVADANSMQHAVTAGMDRFGRLDIAYNNAGIELTPNLLAEQTTAEFDRVIDVNALGVFYAMHAEIPAMLAGDGGIIVNASSGLGLRGLPYQSPYVASKHAVLGLTKAAALDYAAQGIRVNALAIGVIDSPLYRTAVATTPGYDERILAIQPNGRIGSMAEVADAVLWLASDASSYAFGSTIVLDGGQSIM
jgi:NAD(P)-dependent dehydrogenase (short-subunit alcohol dehydrogenase family)